ncbi:MAG TPA: SIS domain-containing protein [Gemmatimonadaceae bacterium]|nr:SIS domain-containing protein [Gemmatimonadaceae bacterium]
MTDALAARSAASAAFFPANADRIAALCSRMADRFMAGGRLIAVGASPAARSDVRHVAVEFVHPVIVGKRALPAIGITADAGSLAVQTDLLTSAGDIVIAFAAVADPEAGGIRAAIAAARTRGCLTIAFDALGAEFEFVAPTADALIWQELVETLYHVLWELVHVFFEHGNDKAAASDPGQSAFLYPFLGPKVKPSLTAVREDVARSVIDKARETEALRRATMRGDDTAHVTELAAAMRARLDAGGTVLTFGNGGSATDATDFVADLRSPPQRSGLARRPALDLTDDPSILTALANDVGNDLVFARQVAAYGRRGDVAVAFSTSGSSRNIVAALKEARRRGLLSVALVGYDGGDIVAERLADCVVVAPSQHIPRIQEAHATAYHALRVLIG